MPSRTRPRGPRPRHPREPTIQRLTPLFRRRASIRMPVRRRRARCRRRPEQHPKRSRSANASTRAKSRARRVQPATERTARARRRDPTSRAANGCGATAVSLRSRTPSPSASRNRRSTALRCRRWAGPSCPPPSFRPSQPMSGRWAVGMEVEAGFYEKDGAIRWMWDCIVPQDRIDRGNTRQAAFRRRTTDERDRLRLDRLAPK